MSAFKYGFLVTGKKLSDQKTMVIWLLQFFVIYLMCKPLIQFSRDTAYPVVPLIFPFLLANIRYLFLFVLSMIYYFSDIPFLQYSEMYHMIRLGRRRWCIGQITAVFLRSFSMVGINILFSIIVFWRRAEVSLDWGKALYTLTLTNASELYNMKFAINYEALSGFTPLQLSGLTWFIGGTIVSFLAVLMFMISLLAKRILAISVAVVMDIMTFLMVNLHPMLQQLASKYIPLSWMRIALIDTKINNSYQLPSMEYMGIVLATGMVLMCLIILWKMKHVELQWSREKN